MKHCLCDATFCVLLQRYAVVLLPFVFTQLACIVACEHRNAWGAAGVDEVLTRLDKKGVATSATEMRDPCMVRGGPLESVSPGVAHLHLDNLTER